MTANSKDEKPSAETKKIDPTWIAKPILKEGGGSFGSGAGGGGGGVGTLGSPGGGPTGGISGRGTVGGVGTGNSGGVSPSGGLNGFGSSRGTGNSGGVGIQGGGVPVYSTGYPSGNSSTTQPKKPQQPTKKSIAQPRSQTPAPSSNPTLDYLNIPASKNPNDAVIDRALREVRKNPNPRPSRKRQRTRLEGNPFISSPLPPTKVTRPKRRKDDSLFEIPKQKGVRVTF